MGGCVSERGDGFINGFRLGGWYGMSKGGGKGGYELGCGLGGVLKVG